MNLHITHADEGRRVEWASYLQMSRCVSYRSIKQDLRRGPTSDFRPRRGNSLSSADPRAIVRDSGAPERVVRFFIIVDSLPSRSNLGIQVSIQKWKEVLG